MIPPPQPALSTLVPKRQIAPLPLDNNATTTSAPLPHCCTGVAVALCLITPQSAVMPSPAPLLASIAAKSNFRLSYCTLLGDSRPGASAPPPLCQQRRYAAGGQNQVALCLVNSHHCPHYSWRARYHSTHCGAARSRSVIHPPLGCQCS